MAHQQLERVAGEQGVAISNHNDIAARLGSYAVEGSHLPTVLRLVVNIDTPLGISARDLHGFVCATIRGNENLKPIGRVVQGQRVLYLSRDPAFLVVGGDNDRHPRPFGQGYGCI